jgi:hypothetical protein
LTDKETKKGMTYIQLSLLAERWTRGVSKEACMYVVNCNSLFFPALSISTKACVHISIHHQPPSSLLTLTPNYFINITTYTHKYHQPPGFASTLAPATSLPTRIIPTMLFSSRPTYLNPHISLPPHSRGLPPRIPEHVVIMLGKKTRSPCTYRVARQVYEAETDLYLRWGICGT